MHSSLFLLFASIGLWPIVSGIPTPTQVEPRSITYTDSNPNEELWDASSSVVPQPQRDGLGAKMLGPHNVPIELQNADLLAPPTTDHGSVSSFKWPFSFSHNTLYNGGWARTENTDNMPTAADIAGVNMRLEAGAIRELHWHSVDEWAYVLEGDVRISTITPEGQVWVGDASKGDLWYFPAGNPHHLQAKNSTPGGAEFLIILDDGAFSPSDSFLLTDWLAHTPKSVLAKNFGMDNNLQAFDHIPASALNIFPGTPPPEDINEDMVVPNNTPSPFTFAFSKVVPEKKPGGTLKVVDSRSFTVSKKIAAAEVELDVGGIRELHWHPTQPEWTFFISGEARITLFAGQANAATFDFYPGDVAYIPPSFGHYIENTGNTTLRFIEVLKSAIFQDISLSQWLALTPPEIVKAHLGFSDDTMAHLSKTKQTLVV